MARPRADVPAPEEVRALLDAEGRLALRVTPGARQESVSIESGRLQVKVRARPTDGAANEAVRMLLAQALDVTPSRLRMLRGATSREKLFQLQPL